MSQFSGSTFSRYAGFWLIVTALADRRVGESLTPSRAGC
jgi:hypothetical protein